MTNKTLSTIILFENTIYNQKENIMFFDNVLKNIGKIFSQDKLPIINGIVSKDNYFKIDINLNSYSMRINKSDFCENYFDEENYSYINISGTVIYKNHTINYGEGSHGGEGFIIIIDVNNKIKWIMFHDEINPIEKLEITNNKIIGINNCGIKYEFEIDWENI